jgi:tRNA (guanine-N7-)-methyltransferase
MTRKSFGIRHLKALPPDEQTAARYLLAWNGGELYHERDRFPLITSAGLFGNDAPLELEIGCGTGDFICSLAAMEPATNFVGLDISLKSLYIAVEKARALSLDNIKFVKAPLQLVYPLLPPGSLQAVYLHYPDPCLRPKFRPRRIFTPTFLGEMYRVLSPGGRLSVMTDVPELFDSMLDTIEADRRFEKTHPERYLVGFDASAKSRYQAIWERHGREPVRFEVRRRET